MSIQPLATDPIYASPVNSNECGALWNPALPNSANPATYCNPSPYWDADRKRILSGLMNAIDPMMRASMALCGTPAIQAGSATSLAGAYYCAINVITDTILNVAVGQSNLVDSNAADVNIAGLAGITLPAGTVLYGNWKKVVTVSGVVQLMPHPFL